MSTVPDELLADVSHFLRHRATSILIAGHLTPVQRADVLHLIACESGGALLLGRTGDTLALAAHRNAILVVDALDTLLPDDQQQLFRWLDEHPQQVVSFATTSVYPLVQNGFFSEALFYRLNVITTTVDPSQNDL